jgi:hypothetical protein
VIEYTLVTLVHANGKCNDTELLRWESNRFPRRQAKKFSKPSKKQQKQMLQIVRGRLFSVGVGCIAALMIPLPALH